MWAVALHPWHNDGVRIVMKNTFLPFDSTSTRTFIDDAIIISSIVRRTRVFWAFSIQLDYFFGDSIHHGEFKPFCK